jgi:hypothetical protein
VELSQDNSATPCHNPNEQLPRRFPFIGPRNLNKCSFGLSAEESLGFAIFKKIFPVDRASRLNVKSNIVETEEVAMKNITNE